MQFKPFTLGKYEFVELLGRGGMAEVYRVNLRGAGNFQKPFAVKRILSTGWAEAKLVERFEREASLNSILSHPNIVQVFEFFRADDTYFLVMEFIEGWNLRQLGAKCAQDGKSIPIELAVYLILEVAQGLDYAHRKCDPQTGEPLHIIHRDISPSNIMMSRDGAVKLCDFGVAKIRSQMTQTDSGLLLGKAPYMSPEQAKGEHLDHRSDLFSLATVFWELLMGHRLYEGGSEIQTLRLAQDCRIPKPSMLNPRIPLPLDRFLTKALSADPKARHQSASEFHEELIQFQSGFCPSYTQRRASAFLLSVFEGAPVTPPADTQEVAPLRPGEEEAMEEGLRRLSDVLGEARAIGGRQPIVTRPENTKAEFARGKKRRRPAPGMKTLPPIEGEPVFREEVSVPRSRSHLSVAVYGVMGAIVLALLGWFASLDLRPLFHAFSQATGSRIPTGVDSAMCQVTVSSAPSGAEVSIDHVMRGTSPLTLSQICGSSPEVELSLSGYRKKKERVTISKPEARFDFSLSRLAPGSLQLTVNRAARVYIDERHVGDVLPREVFRFPLEPGSKYHVIVTDMVTGKSVLRSYAGSDETVVRDSIEFEP